MVETILSTPLVREVLLPFVLLFAVTFAVLQKTKVLGAKKQIDAIVSLVIGLIVVSFGTATGYIIGLIPFLGVSLIIILVFMILWGFAFHSEDFNIHKYVTWGFGVVIGIALIIAVLVVTPGWDYIISLLGSGARANFVTNAVMIVVVIAAIVAVLVGGKSGGGEVE